MQLTPTLKIRPDLQFVSNPAFNSGHDHAIVFQLQLALAW
jgi:carbohydrate-selective porin OprB